MTLTLRLTDKTPVWAEQTLKILQTHADVIISQDAHEPDLVLHFGHYDETLWQQHQHARLGFWFFRFAEQDIAVRTAARLAAAAQVALESSLWVKYPDGRCQCLYQSFGQNDAFATWRTVARTLAKAAHYPVRVLTAYQQTGELTPIATEHLAVADSNIGSLFAEAKAVLTKIYHKLFFNEQWFIAVGKGTDLMPDPKQAHWLVMPPSDSFWADPFPIEQNGRLWLLFEALPFAKNRGYLAAMELFADGTHSEVQTIMTQDYHLSYPFYFHWQGDLYLLPEAGESRQLTAWRCVEFPTRWEKAAVLLNDVCFTDASMIQHDGLYWLFLTIGAEDGICLNEELHIYYADNPFGTWTAHAQNPVKSDARSARPAGNLFQRAGVLYRPAQDCGTGYGKAVVLQRIDTLTCEQFSETAIARLNSDWRDNNHCTHTLSRSEQYWAVDGLRLLARWA